MMWVVALLLVAALLGLPLTVTLTGTTAALGGGVGILALSGLLTGVSPLLMAAALVSLVEEVVALLQAGKPMDLLSPVLLGIVIYVLLDIGAFMINFRGVSVDAGVFRMKAGYWGWTSALGGLTGLALGLLAASIARPLPTPLLPPLLALLAAGVVIGAAIGAIRTWHK